MKKIGIIIVLFLLSCGIKAQNKIDSAQALIRISELSKYIDQDTLHLEETWYYYRSMYYYGIGKYAEAKKDFEEYLTICYKRGRVFINSDQLYDVYLHLGWTEGYFNSPEKAIKYYQAASEIDSLQSKPYFQLGYVYMNQGDTLKACSYFNKAKHLNNAEQIPINCKN